VLSHRIGLYLYFALILSYYYKTILIATLCSYQRCGLYHTFGFCEAGLAKERFVFWLADLGPMFGYPAAVKSFSLKKKEVAAIAASHKQILHVLFNDLKIFI
jgi:hypothetical protein